MNSPPPSSPTTLTYKDAGVDIDAGEALVERIKAVAARTKRPGVMGGLGGFGGLFALPAGFEEPILVSGTDGVGTKVRLAIELDCHDSVGIDLVAMCVNDIVVCGAEPLYFLDYYATGKLNVDVAADVVSGIGKGCELAGCALIGGETAEMPGMYSEGDYDLAGFAVGIVEKAAIIDGSQVTPGDAIVGLSSSGPHSNGYSLLRKVIELSGADLDQSYAGRPLRDQVMAPTRIYVKPLLALIEAVPVRALSHITGGGLIENIPRVLPANTKAVLDASRWQRPPVFDWLREQGNIERKEMARTFNCGLGMVVVVPRAEAERAVSLLQQSGETAQIVGEIATAEPNEEQVVIRNLDQL